MKSVAARPICRFLIASVTAMSFSAANAGMIGADQLTPSGSVPSDRAVVMVFVTRAEVASELQARGIDPQGAAERVAAMTDPEVHALRGQIDALPAGAGFSAGPAAALALVAIAAAIALVVSLILKLIAGGGSKP